MDDKDKTCKTCRWSSRRCKDCPDGDAEQCGLPICGNWEPKQTDDLSRDPVIYCRSVVNKCSDPDALIPIKAWILGMLVGEAERLRIKVADLQAPVVDHRRGSGIVMNTDRPSSLSVDGRRGPGIETEKETV